MKDPEISQNWLAAASDTRYQRKDVLTLRACITDGMRVQKVKSRLDFMNRRQGLLANPHA